MLASSSAKTHSGVRERTMLPGVSQVRPGPGHRQGVREPGFSSRCRWPVGGRLAVWPTRKKQRSLLAGDGTTGDARDGQGPYRSWKPAGLAGLGARGPGPGGGGRGYRAMDIGRVSPSGRIEVQEQIDLASSRRRDLDICWTWETAEELLEARWVVGECRNRS